MALDKSSSFTRTQEFRLLCPQILKKSQSLARPKRLCVRSYFGETFPPSSSRLKTVELHTDNTINGHGNCVPHPAVSRGNGHDWSKWPKLHYTRLQLSEEECKGLMKRPFGQYLAREAVLDEEIWTAAWLRAEARLENFPHSEVECLKRQYCQDEFYDLKKRNFGRSGNCLRNFCFIAVRKEEKHIKRTVIKSVVGTLDLSLRQYLKGETYPGEVVSNSRVFASQDSKEENKYLYVSNVVVAKFARGRDIATNMIYLAIDVAALSGMKKLFVHVNESNKIAQGLYKKTGFEFVDVPPLSPPFSESQTPPPLDFPPEERRLLMSMEL